MFIQMIIEEILRKTAETTIYKYEDLSCIYCRHKKLEILFKIIYMSQNTGIDIFAISNSFAITDNRN